MMDVRTEKTGRFQSAKLWMWTPARQFWHRSEGQLVMLLSFTACGAEMSGPKDFLAFF